MTPQARIEELFEAQASIRGCYRMGAVEIAIAEFHAMIAPAMGAADPRVASCARRIARSLVHMVDTDPRVIKALRDPDYTLARVPNTIRQSIAEVIEDQAAALERAYGILWRMPDAATGHARKLLLEAIGREGQKRGITYAQEMFGPASEAEFLATENLPPIITEADIASLCGGGSRRRP